jgi:hypothetical protein
MGRPTPANIDRRYVNDAPVAEVARIPSDVTGIPLDHFDISRHGRARSLKISAGLPSENRVLAPLWFALKSRLLRQFLPLTG